MRLSTDCICQIAKYCKLDDIISFLMTSSDYLITNELLNQLSIIYNYPNASSMLQLRKFSRFSPEMLINFSIVNDDLRIFKIYNDDTGYNEIFKYGSRQICDYILNTDKVVILSKWLENAIKYNHYYIVEKLLTHKNKIKIAYSYTTDLSMIKLIYKYYPLPKEFDISDLLDLIYNRKWEVIIYLLSKGVKINRLSAVVELIVEDSDNESLIRILELLIKNNQLTINNDIMNKIIYYKSDILKLLFQKELIGPNLKGNNLLLASICLMKCYDILKILIEYKYYTYEDCLKYFTKFEDKDGLQYLLQLNQ